MLLHNIFIIILLYCSMEASETAKRRFKLELTNYTCKSFSKRMKIFDCDIHEIGNSIYIFNSLQMFDKDMENNFDIRVRLDFKQPNMRNSIRFIDLKLKACDVLAYSFQNILLKGLLDEMRRTSTIPYMCPIEGNVLYKVSNFTLTGRYIPSYAPYMNFAYCLEYFENSQLHAMLKIMGALAPK